MEQCPLLGVKRDETDIMECPLMTQSGHRPGLLKRPTQVYTMAVLCSEVAGFGDPYVIRLALQIARTTSGAPVPGLSPSN
jgi:hypothetical protein